MTIFRKKIHYVTIDGKIVPPDCLSIEPFGSSSPYIIECDVWRKLPKRNLIEEYIFDIPNISKQYTPKELRDLAKKNNFFLPDNIDFDFGIIDIDEEAERIEYWYKGESYLLTNPKKISGIIVEDQIYYEGKALNI